MRENVLSWTNQKLPLIGQGTWMLEQAERRRAVETIQTGIDAGMSVIDTAEMYGDGKVEEIVGEAIAGRRERVFLISKVLPVNASFDGTRRACERSLKRLRTDHIDLYLLHWPGAVPIGETIRAMEALIAQQQIRYMGVSNFDLGDLRGALKAVRNERLACNQVLYHLRDRGIERRLVPLCEKHQIGIMGYSPFGHGEFPAAASPEGGVLAEIGARHSATPRQVALAFLIRNGIFTIPKSRDASRMRENAAAADLKLTAEDREKIERAFPLPESDTPIGVI